MMPYKLDINHPQVINRMSAAEVWEEKQASGGTAEACKWRHSGLRRIKIS